MLRIRINKNNNKPMDDETRKENKKKAQKKYREKNRDKINEYNKYYYYEILKK